MEASSKCIFKMAIKATYILFFKVRSNTFHVERIVPRYNSNTGATFT